MWTRGRRNVLQEVFATHILVPNDRVSQENDQHRPLCPFPYFSRSPKGDCMKRPSTYSALVLLTSGLVLTAPLVVHPGPIRAESDRTFTIDVAEDCRTGVVNSANPHEDT